MSERIIGDYNDVMYSCCLEHLTIGTPYSESTDGWTARDMVSECQYQLDLYYNADTVPGEMRDEDPDAWERETKKLEGFINKYRNEASDTKCKENHCSEWDS